MKWYKVPNYRIDVTKCGKTRDSKTLNDKNPWLDKNGYLQINVHNEQVGKNTTRYVHQLVALTFIGPCPKGKEVNHKDLDKSNNHYKNLEYKTHLKNVRHAVKHGVFKDRQSPYGEKNPSAKLTEYDVISIRWLHSTDLFYHRELSKEYNISRAQIGNIINNKVWKH